MTVRFKESVYKHALQLSGAHTVTRQTEYQRSYRSRSVSPQRCALFAGLRSDHMGISREPCIQRRKKFNLTLCDPPHQTFNEPACDTNPSKPLAVLSLAETEAPPVSEHAEQPVDTNGNPAFSDQFATTSQKPSRNSPAFPNQQQSPTDHSLRRKAGLESRGQSFLHETEYNRQFHLKKAPAAPSPVLTAHQALYSSHSTVPPFKKNPVAMDTEYLRSFQGLAPNLSPRLRKKLEYEPTPLFYTLVKRKSNNLLEKKSVPGLGNEMNRSQSSPKQRSHDHAPSKLKRHRILTEYESRFRNPLSKVPEEDAMASHILQVKELKEQAMSYRRRAWGTNFSRDHLSQLQSEHNALWEPTETIDSTSDCPQSIRLDLCQISSAQPEDSGGTSCLEALDLASNSGRSSKRSSAVDSKDEETDQTKEITKTNATPPQSSQSPLVGDHLPFEEHDKSDGDEEGRVPTPKLKMLPVQRTHLDITTPATGGAILVGKLKESDEVIQRSGTADSVLANAATSVQIPVKPREAWSPVSTQLKPATSPVSKPDPSQRSPRVKSALPLTAPLHCIHGTLRHADFQHNGELGLRFKEQKCSSGCCGSDEDDRLSVMSWRSAASCSLASAVLERAQKRRDNFWGKR